MTTLIKKSSNFVHFGLKSAIKHQFSGIFWLFPGENGQNKELCLRHCTYPLFLTKKKLAKHPLSTIQNI